MKEEYIEIAIMTVNEEAKSISHSSVSIHKTNDRDLKESLKSRVKKNKSIILDAGINNYLPAAFHWKEPQTCEHGQSMIY